MKGKWFFGALGLVIPCVSNAQTPEKKTWEKNIKAVNYKVQFYTDKIVRISKAPKSNAVKWDDLPYLLVSPVNVHTTTEELADEYVYRTDSLEVHINKTTGAVSFHQGSTNLLKEDPAITQEFTPLRHKKGMYRIKQGFSLDADEAIYGLGQHQKGLMNQRNQRLMLQQTNMEIAMPVFQSIKGYGVIWNNASSTLFNDTLQQTYLLSDKGNAIDYFFVYGGGTDNVVSGIRYLTGSVPMPPMWAFGFFQSRERYKSQEELLDVVKNYRQLKVPLDGIVQDWRYWGMDLKDWNSTKFGNPAFNRPKDMIDSVHLLNAHMLISVWPSFGPNTEVYKELNQKGLLLKSVKTWPTEGGVTVYNAFSKEGRDIVWKNMNKNIFSLNMDGWWLDATEPIDKATRPYIKILEHSKDTIPTVLNSYPLYTTSGVAKNWLNTTRKKRVMILTRSAFIGQQHYGTFVWSGDISSTWEVMKDQISGALNIGMSGIPYWNTDIGGFYSIHKYPKGLKDTAFHELYVRWLELGTFFPMMRSHGTNTPREIYQFGKKGDWAYDAIEKYIRLRYQLLPYNYSTAHNVTENNASFMRPLFADFPNDKETYDLRDEFLYGNAFLIAPVVESQYIAKKDTLNTIDFSSVKTKKVYLPNGTKWFDFLDNTVKDGGQWIDKKTPIDVLPIYVKAGTVLPLAKVKQYVSESKDTELEVRVYPGANGKFVLYEDEGDNYNYQKKQRSLITFEWNDAEKTLTIQKQEGKFPGSLFERTFNIAMVGDGHLGDNKSVVYKGEKVVVKF